MARCHRRDLGVVKLPKRQFGKLWVRFDMSDASSGDRFDASRMAEVQSSFVSAPDPIDTAAQTAPILETRHQIEAFALFAFAVVAIVLELGQIDTVLGRDPFRVVLPAFCVLLGLLLFDLLSIMTSLQKRLGRIEEILTRVSADQQITETYQRLGGFGDGPETKDPS